MRAGLRRTLTSPNPLVAKEVSSTTWYTGLGLVEDAAQISSGIGNNSWVDGTLGTVGGALDIIGMAMNPGGRWWPGVSPG